MLIMALKDNGAFLSDKSVWNKMKKNVNAGKDLELKTGFLEDAVYGPENDNLPVAVVAQWNEDGVNGPSRPFLTVGFGGQLRKGMYKSYFVEGIVKIIEGGSTYKAEYSKLGEVFVEDIKDIIEKWDTPPNSPKTIDEKGRDDPLVWTGFMHDSVDYKIGKKGKN